VRVREQARRIFTDGVDNDANLASELMKSGLQMLVQQGLEQEQADFVGRERYERGSGNGWRNGDEPGRIKTAEVNVGIQVPQVRGSAEPFHPKLLAFLAAIPTCWSDWSPRCMPAGCPPATWRAASGTPPASW
jgi:hypothetical protein